MEEMVTVSSSISSSCDNNCLLSINYIPYTDLNIIYALSHFIPVTSLSERYLNFPTLYLEKKAYKIQVTRSMTQLINGGTQMQTRGSPSLECAFTYSVILIYSSRINRFRFICGDFYFQQYSCLK